MQDAIEVWLHTKRPLTQREYRRRLQPFLAYLRAAHGRDAYRCRRKHLLEWLNQVLKPKGLKSEHGTYTAISSFFKHLHDQRLISSDPTRSIPCPKTPERSIPRRLSKEEVQRILDVSKKHQKARPMIICSLYGSLRIGEVRNLKKTHLRKVTAGARPTYHLFVAVSIPGALVDASNVH